MRKKGGARALYPLAEGASDFEVFIGETDMCAAYAASVVDTESGKTNDETDIRKCTLYDTAEFAERYNYDGELGVKYGAAKSEFYVWAPFASSVTLRIYDSGDLADTERVEYKMKRGGKGVWKASVKGDLKGKYYTYSVSVDGCVREVVDPYAVAVGAFGARGAIVDLKETDPNGWADSSRPAPEPFTSFVIYEAHLRDLTIHPSSNVSQSLRGKYLGLTEEGTSDNPTPLDYLKRLGVSAVHFQPLFDFASADESSVVATRNREGEFNWGYDPQNYNAPEGSYSTDPKHAATRIKELKSMIAALHAAGIRVIADVVYNHMFDAASSSFQALAPYYFFRTDNCGNLLDGSGCGNETASDRYMFRRFMTESTAYWAREYKLDGFRFDLMALHDVDTMNAVCAALASVDSNIVVYGEGWDAGSNGLPAEMRACKVNARKMPNVAFFDDIVRDGLRGSVFDLCGTGYVSGRPNAEAAVIAAAAGGTDIMPDAMYKSLGEDKEAFASSPSQNVNYVSCHDNATLWDKLNASVDADFETVKAMNRLAAVAVMTGQGASFMLAGEEFLRSKPTTADNAYSNHPHRYKTGEYVFADNSYRSPDSVNELDYSLAEKHADVVNFYSGLIKIKRTFSQFRIENRDVLKDCLRVGRADGGKVVYAVRDPESDEFAFVLLNAGETAERVKLPRGAYRIYVDCDRASGDKSSPLATLVGDEIIVPARSALVMTASLAAAAVDEWSMTP